MSVRAPSSLPAYLIGWDPQWARTATAVYGVVGVGGVVKRPLGR
ncbi:hypothetical protein MILUP08_45789 [Micromonospora lupini str. Lupac 08]|uniref:Uncharacterized protein n=1 Tax=Micromonospora lupini str. Lupac 08 TaxID=1150864 RepID=I0LAP8_9ACTN|nr:hypothetical protein MILUP08_45789 [Micromonospora lupini str. Lupac 08]